jgi:hypothetical protein
VLRSVHCAEKLCLKEAPGADSLLLGTGDSFDDGLAASDAGGAVLWLQSGTGCPDNHLLRKIDRFVDLTGMRAHLGPFYSDVGRPSIDPEPMIRMPIVGCFGIRSERRLCEEVHLNLAYRWFCRLGLDGGVKGRQPKREMDS